VAHTAQTAAADAARSRVQVGQRTVIAWLASLAVAFTCLFAPTKSVRAQSPIEPLDASTVGEYTPTFLLQPEPLPPAGDDAADAETEATPPEAMNPEVAELLERIEALEAAVAAKDGEEPAEKPKEDAPAEKEPEKKDPLEGWTDLSTDKWTIKLGGHMQADFIHWADTDPNIIAAPVQGAQAKDYFEFRRLRLLADGTGYGVYDFRIQIDLEPESGDSVATPVTDIKDAYFSLNELPGNHRWRIGNFFVPFSLEQVTNDTNNIFMERSIPTQGIFAADREVGMALYGVNDLKNITWTGGVFLDSISESLKERIDDNQGHRLSGRLTFLPYYDEPSNGRYLIHTGCGVLYTNDQDDTVRFRARPQIHEGPFLIESLGLNAGSYTTGNLELATVWGPVSVQSEAFVSNVNFIGAPSQNCYGAYVYGSYFLTGENRIYERFGQHGAQFARNVPFTNVFWAPGCCGYGAWEAKCRWSNLTLTEVGRGEYNDITCGFNWYWSDRVRCMFDWIHPITDVGTTPFGATTSDIIAMRFDFNF
jgi:phosphate-selective porin OprO/OprP